MNKELAALAEEIEAALVLKDNLADRAIAAISAVSSGRSIQKSDLDSTDKVLELIYSIKPAWNVSIRGTASMPNGHWRCSLRKSAGRDNDEYVGVGRGPTLPHSLLASLLKVMAFSAR